MASQPDLVQQLPLVGVNCPVCASGALPHLSGVRDTITAEAFDIAICPECGLGITDPQPLLLDSYYRSRYYGGRHSFTASLCVQRRTRLIAGAVSRPGRLLDVGCGDGALLRALRRAGWDAAGTELHGATQLPGCRIFRHLEEAASHGLYDCITMWHVLEHVPAPLVCLAQLRSMLAPGGVLLLAVPDAGGWQARLFGRHWLHLDVPRHLYHFTGFALEKMLCAAGFSTSAHWHQEVEYDVFGWIQSVLNAAGRTSNVLFDSLTGKPPRVSRVELAANYLAGAALAAPAMALTAISTLARRGGTLIVAAHSESR